MSAFKSSEQNAVLITGASGGIGFATLLACLKQGWHVFAACRDATKLQDLVDTVHAQTEINITSANLTCLEYDVCDSQSIKHAFTQIQSSSYELSGLVNAAGVMHDAPLLMQTNTDFEYQMQVNVLASLNHIQFASRLMKRAKRGSVINISSVVGVDGSEGQIAYSATKAAIIGITKSAAKELAPLGIRVNAVAPGFIQTQLTANYDQQKQAELINRIKLGRFGKAEEVAATILHLLSENSAYTSGQILRIDGLMSL